MWITFGSVASVSVGIDVSTFGSVASVSVGIDVSQSSSAPELPSGSPPAATRPPARDTLPAPVRGRLSVRERRAPPAGSLKKTDGDVIGLRRGPCSEWMAAAARTGSRPAGAEWSHHSQ